MQKELIYALLYELWVRIDSVFMPENPYFGQQLQLLQTNMISPVLIGGFVEMDRSLLCMHRIGWRLKSLFDDPH